jgi:hypothetical protein
MITMWPASSRVVVAGVPPKHVHEVVCPSAMRVAERETVDIVKAIDRKGVKRNGTSA